MNIYIQLLRKYLSTQKWRATLLITLVITSIGLRLANPQFVRFFIDSAESGRSLDRLLGAAGLFIFVALVRQAIDIASTFVGEQVAWIATNALRADLAEHCLKLDMSFHKVNKPGELIERVDGDVNQLAKFFSDLVIRLFTNFLLIIGVVVLVWQIDWRFGVSFALIVTVGLLIINSLQKLTVPRWGRLREADTNLFGYLEEWLMGSEIIRSSRAEQFIMNRLHMLQRERWLSMRSAMRMNSTMRALPSFVFLLAYIAAHLWGTFLFTNEILTIGTLYLVFYYIDVIKDPVWEVSRQVQDFQRAAASVRRIAALFQERPTIHDGAGVDFPDGALSVRFNQVDFHYADEPETAVLQKIDFTLEPGKVLGLLGRTGSGKSTLSKLIFRFYDVTEGDIKLGGFDIRDATQSQLRQRIGMVTQEVELLNSSLRNNLTLFNMSITDEQILETLQLLGLEEWFNGLADGLDTYIASTDELSSGEAQLLAFARIFLFDPGLVILDEASSRLDPVTELLIEKAIDYLLNGRTAIIIAHRLATVQRADQIMILEKGQITEHDTRERLLANPLSQFSQLIKTGLGEGMSA
ncbi:MAG: ABC transporter ATP-binding protein [Chloroflexota bacterium]